MSSTIRNTTKALLSAGMISAALAAAPAKANPCAPAAAKAPQSEQANPCAAKSPAEAKGAEQANPAAAKKADKKADKAAK